MSDMRIRSTLVGDRRQRVMDALDSVLGWRLMTGQSPGADRSLGELADAVLAALDGAP